MLEVKDTIAAIATAAGAGAVGIVRVSGPDAQRIMVETLDRDVTASPRRLTLATARDQRGAAIDEVLAVFMPGPRSYTGEDVGELHGHGGSANLSRLLSAVLDAGARIAEPGEFTRRAFLNGRIDLTEAEGVLTLIEATSERAQRLGLALVVGELRERIASVRARVTTALAELEAAIDFPEDVGELEPGSLAPLVAELESLAAGGAPARALRDGFSVALVGAVNAGKSSLFNRLLGRERALVAAEAGTTRDYLEAEVEIEGVRVTLVDTAGERAEAEVGGLETAGARLGATRASESDLQLVIVPVGVAAPALGERQLLVRSKADLRSSGANGDIETSALSGAGFGELRSAILARACGVHGNEPPLLASARQRQLIESTLEAVRRAQSARDAGAPAELVAADLQRAQKELSAILGEEVGDEVLDALFARFCIGK